MTVEVKIVNYKQIGPKSRKKDARDVNIGQVKVVVKKPARERGGAQGSE